MQMKHHVAIPCRDVKEARDFYVQLGAKAGREYSSHVVLNLFDMQLVCHLADSCDAVPSMYPRHIGFILKTRRQVELLWAKMKDAFEIFESFFTRHEGKPEEHYTFFLVDPSNNVIEFKAYKDIEKIFT